MRKMRIVTTQLLIGCDDIFFCSFVLLSKKQKNKI